MLGKPRDGRWARGSWGGPVSPPLPRHPPRGRGRCRPSGALPAGQGGSRRGAPLSPGPAERVWGHGGGTVLFTLWGSAGQSGGGTPGLAGRLRAGSRAAPAQPSRIWPWCSRLQHPTRHLLELGAVSPAPGKLQHSQKYGASKPRGPGKLGEPEVPVRTGCPPAKARVRSGWRSPEQGLRRRSCPRLRASHRGGQALGAFTGGYPGHQGKTGHSKAPYPTLGSRVPKHFTCSPFPEPQLSKTGTERSDSTEHQTAWTCRSSTWRLGRPSYTLWL